MSDQPSANDSAKNPHRPEASLKNTADLDAQPHAIEPPLHEEPGKKNNFMLELLINVIIPTLILSFLSKEKYLGNKVALIVALAFPIGYGIKELMTAHKINFFSVIGVVTVALTGGMGLMEIDPKYIAIKEAAIPAALGIFTLVSLKTRYPLVKTFLFNDQILQIDRINDALIENNTTEQFERSLAVSSMILAASFFLSATTNYLLAKIVLVSAPGTEAFNVELGRMIALSYPVNVLPAMLVMIVALVYIYRSIRKYTHLPLEQILHNVEEESAPEQKEQQ